MKVLKDLVKAAKKCKQHEIVHIWKSRSHKIVSHGLINVTFYRGEASVELPPDASIKEIKEFTKLLELS